METRVFGLMLLTCMDVSRNEPPFAATAEPCIVYFVSDIYYGRTLSERPCYILPIADVLFYKFFFIPALVGQTAKRIFTKLSYVVDIRCYL